MRFRTPILVPRAGVLVAFLAFTLIGGIGGASADEAGADEGKPFLWVIEGKPRQGRVFLLGSIHLGRADLYPLDDTIEEAFMASDTLGVEVDLNAVDRLSLMMKMRTASYLPDGEQLSDLLEPKVWAKLLAAAEENGVPEDMLQRLKPWAAAMMMSELEGADVGYSALYGVDQYFLDRAYGDDPRTVVSLESIDLQLDMIDSMPPVAQMLMLGSASAEVTRSLLDDSWRIWKTGDHEAMFERLIAPDLAKPGGPEMYEAMFTKRNPGMADVVEELMNEGGISFVMIGAGHVAGDDGVVELLRQRGYRISHPDKGGLKRRFKRPKKRRKAA